MCAGLPAHALFAAHHKVMLRLMRLATSFWDTRVRRVRTPACIKPSLDDRLLMDYYPRPTGGGPPFLPYARRPPFRVPLVVPQRKHPRAMGSSTRGALCMEHGAPLRARWKILGRGITRGFPAATRGTPAPRRAWDAGRPHPRLSRASRSSSHRRDTRGLWRYPPCAAGRAMRPRHSETREPWRCADARLLLRQLGIWSPKGLGPAGSRPPRPQYDHPRDVNHVLGRIYVFFTLLGY